MDNYHLLLYRTSHLARNYLRPYLTEIGLSQGQPRVLRCLLNHGPCSQRQLAEYSEVDPATICRMLDTMEKGGFICRQNDAQDRRAGLVSITEKGRQALAHWQKHCREMEKVMLADFSEQEKAQFAQLLLRVYRNLGGKADKEGEL